MSSLLVIKGPNIGVRYPLGEITRIGRAADNDIILTDADVSRFHAVIAKHRMSYTIRDEHSRHGVMINGQPAREHVLLKNDELRIGTTVFLFNSDLDIRNARFSNSQVHLYPAENETIEIARRGSQLEDLSGTDRESVEFLLKLADLFSSSPSTLAETAERIVSQLMPLFNADAAVLLMRDGDGTSLRPVIALPVGGALAVNRSLAATAIEEGHALLSVERIKHPRSITYDGGEDMDSVEPTLEFRLPEQFENMATVETPEEDQEISVLCAPVTVQAEKIGALLIEKHQPNHYTLRDLGLLQAIGQLCGGALQAAEVHERLARLQPTGGDVDIAASRNSAMQEILGAAAQSAKSAVTILITGESGTGKEVLARFIHDSSPRAKHPFIALNCSAIPRELFESELFGYERGAFTGAARTTIGKIEAAHGGTLFLDEIGELRPETQPKLLRFLQEKTIYRIGSNRAIDVDARVIAATNKNLDEDVRAGIFRQDLWYRLNVMRFNMPPLRERREDIEFLAESFVRRCAQKVGRRVLGISQTALIQLQKYPWPGNIRELENAIERAVLLARTQILGPADFVHLTVAGRRPTGSDATSSRTRILPLSEVEKQHIISALRKCGFNQGRAAEALGLHRNTLRNKMNEYGIDTQSREL